MQTKLVPFNIDLLILTPDLVKGIQPIQVMDIFAGSTRNFHDQGLFSTTIFGKVGDERRSRLYSYIDMRIDIFHPVIFKALCELKQVYGDLMSGKGYAIWDDKVKDFIKSSPAEGDTGYSYFLKHFKEIEFEERDSDKRSFNIRLIKKYRDNCLMSKLIVMPAGLRDYEVDQHGKPTEDEINSYYRGVFSYANLITPAAIKMNPESVDLTRYNIQLKVNTIYEYIKGMLEGKKKLILGKWASRRIYNGTRNVITSLNNSPDRLDFNKMVRTNQTVVGLYQYMKSILPLAIYKLRNGFLASVFKGAGEPLFLVNKKTFKKELVHVNSTYYDDWMTEEGLTKIIERFGEEDLRHTTLKIGDYYLGLIYKGPDGTFKLFQDIDQLPVDRKKEDVSPVTFAELLYSEVFSDAETMPCFVTRYPLINFGGIYPSYVYLKSTVKGEIREQLNDNWQPFGIIANEFPIREAQFMNSMSPNRKHLGRLGADFDGDTCSFNVVYTENAKKEIKTLLDSRHYYVGVDGRMNFSADTDVISLVLASITGG